MRFESTLRSPANGEASLLAKLSRNKKKVWAFVVLLVLSSLVLISLGRFLSPALLAFVQTAGFFGLGYLHFLILKANVTSLTANQKLLYSGLLALITLVVISILSFLFPSVYSWAAALAGICAFLLPGILAEAWRLFYVFFTQAAATWHYNADVQQQKATTFLNSRLVRFKIQAGQFGREYTVSFRAPVRMKLGTIFYHMVQEQNSQDEDAIKLTDGEGQAYEWAFSTSAFGWRNFLEPELTLLENAIKENAVVTAERIANQNPVQKIEMENQQKL